MKNQIEEHADFDSVFLDKVKGCVEQRRSTRSGELRQTQEESKDVLGQQGNISDAIAKVGLNEVLHQKLNRLKARQ
ncbi:MAG: hypothetical protein SNJ75_19750 [Gemmataceae bacterium]